MNDLRPVSSWLTFPRVGVACIVVFLTVVWFRVHSWESYMYAASAEGFFRMSEMFSAVYRGEPVPDISRFHPYHPLFHMVVGALLRAASLVHEALGGAAGSVSALTIAVCVNKLSAVAAAVLAFRILNRLLGDAVSATLATGGMFFTKAFLFGAFSGDAHILSLALFLGSLDLVLDRDYSEERDGRRGALSAALFSLGAAMNLAIFFYGLLQIAVLVVDRRLRALALGVGLSAVLLFGVYVVTPVMLFDLESLEAFTRLYSLYTYLPALDGSLLVLLYAFFDALSAGLVGGIDAASYAARALLALLLLGGAVSMWRAPASSTLRFWVPMWIVGFAVGEILMHTVTSVNGTIYVMLPLFALVGFLLRALKGRRGPFLVVVALLVAVASLNAWKVVVTKATAGPEAAPRLAALRSPPPPDTPVAIRLTHMSLFQEVYYLGHELKLTHLRTFIPMVSASDDALNEWAATQKRYCELSASPVDRPGLQNRLRAKVSLSPDLYHFSVNHPQSKGPIVKHVSFACR